MSTKEQSLSEEEVVSDNMDTVLPEWVFLVPPLSDESGFMFLISWAVKGHSLPGGSREGPVPRADALCSPCRGRRVRLRWGGAEAAGVPPGSPPVTPAELPEARPSHREAHPLTRSAPRWSSVLLVACGGSAVGPVSGGESPTVQQAGAVTGVG